MFYPRVDFYRLKVICESEIPPDLPFLKSSELWENFSVSKKRTIKKKSSLDEPRRRLPMRVYFRERLTEFPLLTCFPFCAKLHFVPIARRGTYNFRRRVKHEIGNSTSRCGTIFISARISATCHPTADLRFIVTVHAI